MKFKKSLISSFFAMGFMCAGGVYAMQDSQLAPAKVNLFDPFNVSITSGQLSPSLSTVSIGGELGLQHSITLEGNHFAQLGHYGYRDSYSGAGRTAPVGKEHRFVTGGNPSVDFSIYRVYAMGDSADFKVYDHNGQVVNAVRNVTGNYTYKALGDTRHKLVRVSEGGVEYLVWTKPDGTLVRFGDGSSGAVAAGETRRVRKVVYPNGLTISFNYLFGVTTNTGYLLRYEYMGLSSDPGLDPTKIIANEQLTDPNQDFSWFGKNPKYIWGVNLAYQTCLPSLCSLNGTSWPKATFNWPGGMPRAFHIGNSTFSVEDPEGLTTSYKYKAYDLAYKLGSVVPSFTPGEKTSPRLVGIKPANSTAYTYTYEYKNKWNLTPSTGVWRVEKGGDITLATGPMGTSIYPYNPDGPGDGASITKEGSWKNTKYRVRMSGITAGAIIEATVEGEVFAKYEESFRNFIKTATPAGSPTKTYAYNAEGNIESITAKGIKLVKAKYPDLNDCTPKTCNKPKWTKDANGAQTDFKYHAPSGNVDKVTGPANKHGIRPQTRYFYGQKYAYYRNNSSSITQADTPIWLLTKESTCSAGAASGNGCANSNNEVVTEYYYGPQSGQANNLHLRGVAVTADNTTRVTCYAYDRYGNQIGVTEPKGTASLTSCH